MPITKLASPEMGMGVEQLTTLMFQYYRELEYLLNGNIDSENVRSITTDKLVAGTALIGTALIDTLVVGVNVTMGPLATISWANVTEQPTIPSQYTDSLALAAWEASGYSTYINSSGVYSGSFNGGMFNVNPTGSSTLPSGITFGGWHVVLGAGNWVGEVFKIQFDDDYFSGFPAMVFSSANSTPMAFVADSTFIGDVGFNCSVDFAEYQHVNFNGAADFNGDADFTHATVTLPGYSLSTHTHDGRYYTETESDLLYATASHNHGNAYIKANDDVYIQYFSDHMEIKLGAGGTWKVISYDP